MLNKILLWTAIGAIAFFLTVSTLTFLYVVVPEMDED